MTGARFFGLSCPCARGCYEFVKEQLAIPGFSGGSGIGAWPRQRTACCRKVPRPSTLEDQKLATCDMIPRNREPKRKFRPASSCPPKVLTHYHTPVVEHHARGRLVKRFSKRNSFLLMERDMPVSSGPAKDSFDESAGRRHGPEGS